MDSKINQKPCNAGFSLVEVSLAILVAGVGLMAVFALFPSGLDAGRAAGQDVRAAQFAESFFGTLRAQAPRGTWETLPDSNLSGLAGTPLHADDTLKPFEVHYDYSSGGSAADYSIYYRATLTRDVDAPRVWQVLLRIWDRTEPSADGTRPDHVFYTELYSWMAVP